MNQQTIFITLLFLCSCTIQDTALLGKWKVVSRFYSATYQIVEENDELNGVVLFYDDGTTQYKYDGRQPRYLFTGLSKKDGTYVDGFSGATPKKAHSKNIKIASLGQDTLEVTTYQMGKPLIETWTRVY